MRKLGENLCGRVKFLVMFMIYDITDMIYLLTAIWLSPGGSTQLQTNNT